MNDTVDTDRHSVLIAEDEPMVRTIAAEVLRDAGFLVWEAEDGKAALELLKNGLDVELLLSDVRMPHMNGYQLLEASLEIRPSLKAIFMTGYAQESVPEHLRGAVVAILKKPFDIDELPRQASQIFAARH